MESSVMKSCARLAEVELATAVTVWLMSEALRAEASLRRSFTKAVQVLVSGQGCGGVGTHFWRCPR